MSTYTREGNIIYFANTIGTPVKVAVINSKGYLQPAKGMGDHRAAVEAFLEADRIPDDVAEAVAEMQPLPLPVRGTIPPCPPEDPAAGDKTPAVIAWWHRYHPEAAAVKYRGRKFAMPDAE
jgi:hypothetical protein